MIADIHELFPDGKLCFIMSFFPAFMYSVSQESLNSFSIAFFHDELKEVMQERSNARLPEDFLAFFRSRKIEREPDGMKV
jgi:hypothetical protein